MADKLDLMNLSLEETEKLYVEFVEWIRAKGVTPDKFRALFRRYYDEFIKEQ